MTRRGGEVDGRDIGRSVIAELVGPARHARRDRIERVFAAAQRSGASFRYVPNELARGAPRSAAGTCADDGCM